jgi:diguanylate cyclase (GGDEF)-like protein
MGKKWLFLPPLYWLVLGFAGLMLLLALQLEGSYKQTQMHALDNADNLSQLLDGQITASMRRIDATLHQVVERMPRVALYRENAGGSAKLVNELLASYKYQFPDLGNLFVWDRQGRILYSSAPLAPDANILARAPFYELQRDPSKTIAFSELIYGRISGTTTLALYVPIRDEQGEMIGAISGGIDIEDYSELFRSLNLPQGSVVLVRNSENHELVLRHPWLESEINRSMHNRLQERIDAGDTSGRERFRAQTDGEKRLYSFRKVSDYPFYVVVGISEHVSLRGWYRELAKSAGGALFIALLLGATLYRIRQVNDERDAAMRRSDETLALMRGALDSVPAGMMVYDQDDKLVMANRVMRSMYGSMHPKMREPGVTFEEIARAGAEQGVFLPAVGREEEWLAERLRQHRIADGQPRQHQLSNGRWVQYSDHRAPHGYTVGSRLDITEQKRLEDELRSQASTDTLTGLPNRRHFMQQLEGELARVRRQASYEACVLMLDLDYFKRVNDQYGHAAGDALLQHFAELVRGQLRGTDSVGRLGGEEFAVILPGANAQASHAWGQRLCDKLAASPLNWGAQQIQATVSIGVAAIMTNDGSPDAALSRADQALYRAKENGRNRVEM